MDASADAVATSAPSLLNFATLHGAKAVRASSR
jgi:hypothetical protein